MKPSRERLESVLGENDLLNDVRVIISHEDEREVWTFFLRGMKRGGMAIYLWELKSGRITLEEIFEHLKEKGNV